MLLYVTLNIFRNAIEIAKAVDAIDIQLKYWLKA